MPPSPRPARRSRPASRQARQPAPARDARAPGARPGRLQAAAPPTGDQLPNRTAATTPRSGRSSEAARKPGVLSFLAFRNGGWAAGPEREQASRPRSSGDSRQRNGQVVPLRAAPGAADPFTSLTPDPFAPAPVAASADAAPAGRFRTLALFGTDGELISLSNERQELLCSVIGLTVKLGLVAVAGVSLFRLAGTYQQRMERQGEIAAVLELQNARMAKARERFDDLFMVEGEQRLIREQSQWIAPDRLRIVWQSKGKPFPTVETAAVESGNGAARP